jgi:hypothetical protein
MIGAFESSMFRMRAFLALHSLVNVRESRCKIAEIDLAKGGRQIDRHGGAGPRSVLRTERHAASGGPDGNFRVALLFRFARVFASQRKAAAAANVEDDLAVFRIGQDVAVVGNVFLLPGAGASGGEDEREDCDQSREQFLAMHHVTTLATSRHCEERWRPSNPYLHLLSYGLLGLRSQ